MLVRAMDRGGIDAFVARLQTRYTVVGPVPGEEHTVFAPIADPAQLRLDYTTTTVPPSRVFLPAEEVLLQFDLCAHTCTPVVPDAEPTILFGVHPCDLHAIALMDEIMTEEPADVHYVRRRRATLLVGWDCREPCHPETLCYDKGTLQVETGYDLFGVDLGEFVLWRARTPAGEALLAEAPGARAASDWERGVHRRADRERDGHFERKLRGDVTDLAAALRRRQNDSTLWNDTIGHACTSCGNCTMVCPTCYCFETSDRMCAALSGGDRVRIWDSCQFHHFTAVAGGEVFRDTAGARQYHRVAKKEIYLPARFGHSGCVGCGRCTRACPADIALIDIYNTVLGDGA